VACHNCFLNCDDCAAIRWQTNAGGMGQSTWGEKMIMSGRLVCDTYIAAKENLRETTYTLAELSRTQLGKTRQEIDFHQVSSPRPSRMHAPVLTS
jgi:DNA polymerase elongation subunit (family B)